MTIIKGATYFLAKPITIMSLVVFLCLVICCIGEAEARMVVIEGGAYTCGNGEQLNTGFWWTEAVPVPGDSSEYILCGGNAESKSGAGVANSKCERIDLDTCSVERLGAHMSTGRQALRPVCITPAQCYLFGGNNSEDTEAARSIDLLDTTTGRVKKGIAKLPEPRLVYAAALLNDGTILITGGYGVKDPAAARGPVHDTALRFNPKDGSFIIIKMNHQRGAHTITRMDDGKYLIIGGNGSDPSGAEIFDPKTNEFTSLSYKMAKGRKDHRAILVSDGKIYIVGGTMGTESPRSIEAFDQKSGRFSDTGLMISEGREDAAVVYVRELDIIVAIGGEIKGVPGEPESKAIDVIDLKKRRVTSGALKIGRDEPTVVVRRVDEAKRTAELLVLTGQRKQTDTEISMPVEIVTVSTR